MTAGEVDAGDLQVPTLQLTLVQRDGAVYGYLLEAATAHGIVGAFNHDVALTIREGDGAVFCVVDCFPDSCFRFNAGLVAVCIELRDEFGCSILGNGAVLVERVGIVHRCRVVLRRELPIADVVVGVLIFLAADCGFLQFGAGVVNEGVVHDAALSGGVAGSGVAKDIVGIGTLSYEGAASVVRHAGEQVAGGLVCLRKRHAVRLGEHLQEIGTGEVGVAKVLRCTTMQESCGGNAAIVSVAGGDGLLYGSVLGIGVAC